eukprot:sb/3461692/
MKGRYKPLPQLNGDDLDNVFHKRNKRTNRSSRWKFCYACSLLVLLFLAAGAGVYVKRNMFQTDVIKPKYDRKTYKAFTLENGLKVLLIHDKLTILSGLGLDVGVGSMSDTEAGEEFLGLAHYTEHAIYMGSENFPGYNELANYLQVHGGNDNAFTTQTHTNFYFYVNSRNIAHGVKIFASAFKKPLFNPEVLEGEKQAIQNELEKDIPQTVWKKFSVLKKTADPEHPFYRFNVGTKEIFDKADFVSKIRWFYEKYYSSHLMNLVLLSSMSLEGQEELIRQEFSGIKRRNFTQPTFFSNPYSGRYIGQYSVYENGALTQDIELLFPIGNTPKDIARDHKVILNLLGDESTGTVTSHLRDKGYIIGEQSHGFVCYVLTLLYICGMGFDLQACSFPTLDLFDDDFKSKYTTMKIPEDWIEYWSSDSTATDGLAIPGPNEFIPTDFTIVPKSTLPQPSVTIDQDGFKAYWKQDSSLPKSYIDCKFFVPSVVQSIENAAVLRLYLAIVSESLDSITYPASSAEYVFMFAPVTEGFKMKISGFSDPEKFFKFLGIVVDAIKEPKLVNPMRFFVPSVVQSIENAAVLRLYLAIVSESLDSITYPASSAEYVFMFAPVTEGFKMKISGFSDPEKFFKFLGIVVDAIKEPKLVNPMRLFFQRDSHDNADVIEIIEKLSQDKVLEKESDYSYSGAVVELPPGRWIWQKTVLNPTELNSCIFVMNQNITSYPPPQKHVVPYFGVDDCQTLPSLDNHQDYKRTYTRQTHYKPRTDPAYATLRTREQLGYTVFTGSLSIGSVEFFYMLLQGSHYTPDVMMEKVMGFLDSYRVTLKHLITEGSEDTPSGDKWFEQTKRDAINRLLSQPESQAGLSDYYASTAQSAWPFFNRAEYTATAARRLKKEDLLDFYDSYIIDHYILSLHFIYPTCFNLITGHRDYLQLWLMQLWLIESMSHRCIQLWLIDSMSHRCLHLWLIEM